MPATERKPRTCLKCGKLFPSAGPGNRICKPCTKENNKMRLTEDQLQRQRGAKLLNGESLDPPQPWY